MTLSRRKALSLSGSTLAGLSLGVLRPQDSAVLQAQGQDDWPDSLVERPLREGFPAPLPLEPDGSAPEHPESAAGPITDPLMWRSQGRRTPEIEFDYRQMAIRVDTRGLGRLAGTLRFSDLEQLPVVSGTYLLQCGAPNPRGIVKWTGVRFSDFADMLGLVPGVHYCRFVASDRFYADEPLTTLRRPQVMLAWMMNDEPIPPARRAVAADRAVPVREPEREGDHRDDVQHARTADAAAAGLIVPFRYGNRSVKAITEMTFSRRCRPDRRRLGLRTGSAGRRAEPHSTISGREFAAGQRRRLPQVGLGGKRCRRRRFRGSSLRRSRAQTAGELVGPRFPGQVPAAPVRSR